jgi:pimeloyl-ACP methyl ester carboxylesterase
MYSNTMWIVLTIIAGVLLAIALLTGIFIAAAWAPELSVAELQPRWAPPPSVFMDVAGMKVHLRDEGPRDDPSPVVLLHGTGSSLHAWEGWADAIKGQRRVIRYDMAGFGLTGPSPDGIYTLDRDIRLLIAILDKLRIERCVLGGNSLGGTISWRTALEHPSRVEKLILVDSGGYPTPPSSAPIGFRLAGIAAEIPAVNWLLKNTLPRSLVVQGMRNVFGDPSKVTPEMVDRAVQLTQREGNREALIARVRQNEPDNFAHRIPELKLPTLIVWGGRDQLTPVSDAHQFHRDIAGSQLAIFDDLGHAPEEEDPARSVIPAKTFLDLK